jgi:hypothetical protein
MGFVTVKDFGIALGVNGVTVRQRIVRGKLTKNEYGLIDVKNVTNFAYVVEINGGDLSIFDNYYKSLANGTNVKKKVNKPNKKQTFLKPKENLIKPPPEIVEISKKTKINKVNDSKVLVNIVPTVEPKNYKEKKVDVLDNIIKETAAERLEKKIASEQRASFTALELRKKTADVVFVERQSELKQIQLEKIAGNTLPLDITTNLLRINLQSIFKTFSMELENIATISVETLGGTRADLVKITNAQNVMLKKIVENAKANANQEIEMYIQEYSETRSRGERKS